MQFIGVTDPVKEALRLKKQITALIKTIKYYDKNLEKELKNYETPSIRFGLKVFINF